MTTRGHFHAYEFECEDEEEETPPAPGTIVRKVRGRRVFFGQEGEEVQLLVRCALRAVTAFEECAECPRFKHFSLDPAMKDSFVVCTSHGEPAALPIPLGASAKGRALRTPLADVMSDPICARPDVPLARLARLFVELHLSGLPVVDETGKALGFVAKTDIVEAAAREVPSTALTVGDVMVTAVEAVPATATLLDAIEHLGASKKHRLPVLNDAHAVVGVISLTDVNAWLLRTEGGAPGKACPAAL